MGRRFSRHLLTVMVVGEMMSSAALVRGQSAPERRPENLEVHPVLQPFVDGMWERSPTFRRQCRRLGAERHARVRLLLEDRPGRPLSFKARSVVTWSDGTGLSARIHVRPSPDAIEHIAHELEHVMEQLDGVDLQARAVSEAAWKSGDSSYETRRAIETGRRVAREVLDGARHAGATAHGQGDGRLLTVRQRDASSSSASRPSARVSAEGRHVVFVSSAQLVEADLNAFPDIYVLDLMTRALTLESVGSQSEATDGWSANPDISGNGRYVVFESTAGNLAEPPVPTGRTQVFLRDRETGVTRLLSINAGGVPANGPSRNAAISADGRSVVLESTATDLLDGVPAGTVGIYLVRLDSGERERVDVPASGESTIIQSMSPSISADGRFVAFASRADLACRDAPECAAKPWGSSRASRVYVRNTHTGVTTHIADRRDGREPDGASYQPAISDDGRYVAFVSEASNLVHGLKSAIAQIYVHDRVTGSTELVSRRPDGRPADGSSRFPAISADGSTIAFQSLASDLVCIKQCAGDARDINLVSDVYLLDRASRKMTRASTSDRGEWMAPSRGPSLDQSGRVLALSSRQPIDDDDLAHDDDLYIHILPGGRS
jgi:Tol biopolymer transport system component